MQDIGDKAGESITLFNMGHIHWQNEEQSEAIAKWIAVYSIAKPMGLAQVLDALENLAEQIGLSNGHEDWEMWLKRSQEGSGGECENDGDG